MIETYTHSPVFINLHSFIAPKFYIGQTGRGLFTGFKAHIKDKTNINLTSNFAIHNQDINHT